MPPIDDRSAKIAEPQAEEETHVASDSAKVEPNGDSAIAHPEDEKIVAGEHGEIQVGNALEYKKTKNFKTEMTTLAGEAKGAVDKLAPKWFMLCLYALTFGMGAFHTGWALFGSTQIFPVLEAKFHWSHSEQLLNHSLIGSASISGVMVGSLFGGPIINYGRRKSILWFSILIYIGAGITLIEHAIAIMVGRFICGIAAGIFNMCNAKAIVETVPVKYNGVFGALTNILICWGGLLALSLGLALPDEEFYEDDEMWRLTYGFPMVLITIQILLLLTVFR